MEPIRVLIITDNTIFGDAFCHSLASYANFTFVGHLRFDEALQQLDTQEADVIVLYVEDSQVDASTLVRDIASPQVKGRIVAIVTDRDPSRTVASVVEAGAEGCVLKKAPFKELVETIEAVYEGKGWCSGSVASAVLARIRELSGMVPAVQPTIETLLTKREKAVLHLIASGHANKEIARELNIAPSTVKNHVHNIFDKLGVKSRREATHRAHEWQILQNPNSSSSLV